MEGPFVKRLEVESAIDGEGQTPGLSEGERKVYVIAGGERGTFKAASSLGEYPPPT